MKCLNCNKEIKASRNTKKFCDTKCRVAFNRKKVDNTELKKGSVSIKIKEVVALAPKVVEAIKPVVVGKPYEPKEGSAAFYLKYGVETKAEIKKEKIK